MVFLLLLSASLGHGENLPIAITNAAEAQAEGRALVQEILAARPEADSAQTGLLKMRDAAGQRTEHSIRFAVNVTKTNWESIFFAATKDSGVRQLEILHTPGQPGKYRFGQTLLPEISALPVSDVPGEQVAGFAFAGSDFTAADLGLEFFHWPEQRVIRKEIRRSRSCKVLESVNPQPATNTYSKVISWIDRESHGIIFAEAYDAGGKLLKEFEPKSFKKVNGRWELEEMEIRNVQTGSRTRLEFNLATE